MATEIPRVGSTDGGSDSDDEFQLLANYGVRNTRYPVHDACEFHDVEFLRNLIFVPRNNNQDSNDEDSGDNESDTGNESDCSSTVGNDACSSDDDSSGTDGENDNAAAAAAALGHHPPCSSSPVGATAATLAGAAAAAVAARLPENNVKSEMSEALDQSLESTTEKQLIAVSEDNSADGRASKSAEDAVVTTSNTIASKSREIFTDPSTKNEGAAGEANKEIIHEFENTASKPSTDSPTTNMTKDESPIKSKDAESLTLFNISPVQLDVEMANNDNLSMSIPATDQGTHDGAVKIIPAHTTENVGNTTLPAGTQFSSDLKVESLRPETETPSIINSDKKAANNKKQKSKRKRQNNEQKKKENLYYCPHDINERDDDENTPLHVAIHSRKLEHMRLLLQARASPHRKCDGSAPIHTAISVGAISSHKAFAYEAVALLHQFNADLSMRDDSLNTPLYLAAVCNLPSVVGIILNDAVGLETLNLRSDRVGGRPLHAAAKFDVGRHSVGSMRVGSNSSHSGPGARPRLGSASLHHQGIHPRPSSHLSASSNAGNGNGNVINGSGEGATITAAGANTKAILTQILVNTPGIEIDPQNNYGRTPLHVATSRGNWQVVRLLLQAGANPRILDRRGFTPGGLAYKRGMPIPNDLIPILGPPGTGMPPSLDASSSIPPTRDLIMDPDGRTLLLCHELCSRHMSCPPITRNGIAGNDPPPENVRRLSVLLNEEVGILRSAEFDGCIWEGESRRAAMADVLKVHEYNYVENVSQICSQLPDHPNAIATLDADTAISRWSFEAAMRAAGSVCEAVDRVMAGDFRNAFCAVRPPGHHAGPRGVVRCANDPEGSHGFCLLNNIAIGAAYARSMYRNDGIRKVAIIDFDVHHGNGTEEIIRQLVPNIEKANVRLPFALGQLEASRYRPWLDETDIQNVFFASTHGYGPRDLRFADHLQQGGWFYPASGKSITTDAIISPSNIENPSLTDFLLSQTWTRMGDESRTNCCKIINVGLDLPRPNDIPGMQRVEVRDSYRKKILPYLLDFDPDIIFISAGFDGHKRDSMNFGYVGMVEDDYEWVTQQLVKVANTCCNGRVVSVLEGGYKIHGGIVSPFARSVASHVRALAEGGNSRELYDKQEGEWESQFERHMIEERERKRQLKMERLNRPIISAERRRNFASHSNIPGEHTSMANEPYDMEAILKEPLSNHGESNVQEVSRTDITANEEAPTRKRRRNQAVDYKELYEQMKKEGCAQ